MAGEQPRSGDENRDDMRDALSRFERSHQDTPPRPQSRFAQRRDAIRGEIERNRRGEYTVPTWVLGLVLALIVAGIVLFVVFG